MKVIVAGGRDFEDYERVVVVLEKLLTRQDTILSGTAAGADRLGERFARSHALTLEEYPADWNAHKKAAGVIRNQQMAQAADCLIAFWDGKSKGTKHMIEAATRSNLEVHIYRYTL